MSAATSAGATPTPSARPIPIRHTVRSRLVACAGYAGSPARTRGTTLSLSRSVAPTTRATSGRRIGAAIVRGGRVKCSVEGCSLASMARGWCNPHYQRWRRTGSVDGWMPRQVTKPPCSVDGCERPTRNRGLCDAHYQRWQDGAPLDGPIRKKGPRGEWRLNRGGYIVRGRGGRVELMHRVVMEESLGRPLRDDETVHHINGDRTDNRIGNLQLRVGAHGSGIAMQCMCCGSHRVEPVPLAEAA